MSYRELRRKAKFLRSFPMLKACYEAHHHISATSRRDKEVSTFIIKLSPEIIMTKQINNFLETNPSRTYLVTLITK